MRNFAKKVTIRLHGALQVHFPGGRPIDLDLDDRASFADLPARLALGPGEVALYVLGSHSVSPDMVIPAGASVDLYPLDDGR